MGLTASAYSAMQVAERDGFTGTVFRVARPTSTARRDLGDELRRLRGDRRGAAVARSLGWSESKLSRIETARTGISDPDLDRLLTAYERPAGRAHPPARPGPPRPGPGLVDAVPVLVARALRRVRRPRGRGRGDVRVGDPDRPGPAADRRVRPRGHRGRRGHRRPGDHSAPARAADGAADRPGAGPAAAAERGAGRGGTAPRGGWSGCAGTSTSAAVRGQPATGRGPSRAAVLGRRARRR